MVLCMNNKRSTRQIRISKEVHAALKDFSSKHDCTICDLSTTILAHYFFGNFAFKKESFEIPTNLKSEEFIEY